MKRQSSCFERIDIGEWFRSPCIFIVRSKRRATVVWNIGDIPIKSNTDEQKRFARLLDPQFFSVEALVSRWRSLLAVCPRSRGCTLWYGEYPFLGGPRVPIDGRAVLPLEVVDELVGFIKQHLTSAWELFLAGEESLT